MDHYAIEHIVHEQIAERQRAADRHRLVSGARRSRANREAAAPAATPRTGDLAVDLAALGFDALEHELARFIRHARTSGVAPNLVAMLADRHAPAVVRERAFSRIARAVHHQPPASRGAA